MSKSKILSDVSGALGRVNDELAGIRAQIAKLNDEADGIKFAPSAEAEALEALRARIREAAGRFEKGHGRPSVLLGVKGDLGLIFGLSGDGRGGLVECLTIGALCWLMPDVIEERLAAWMRRCWQEHPPGLPAKERAAKLAELRDKIGELERLEEALIAEAEGAGIVLDRRADVSPEVFLEVGWEGSR